MSGAARVARHRRLRSIASRLLIALALSSAGCAATVREAVDPVLAARQAAADSSDGEVLGKWLLTELVAPGGDLQQARQARARLDKVASDQRGPYASMGRGLDDEAHGAMKASAQSYLSALDALRAHDAPESEMLAWYVASRLLWLRPSVRDLWQTARPSIEKVIADPGRVGWRARTDLVDWWLFETRRTAGGNAKQTDEEAAKRFGCVASARFAGPFGRPAPLDIVTRFAPEQPGVWPRSFAPDPSRVEAPRVYEAEKGDSMCSLRPTETGAAGVYYVETFLELDHDSELLLSVRAAWSISVDDVEVLAHDPRSFGTWATTSVALRLGAGRHRVVARLGSADTHIRVLDRAGRPLALRSSADDSKGYVLARPRVLPDPQPLAPFAQKAGAAAQAGWPAPAASQARADAADPVLRFLAAELAHLDESDDLATVLIEPLVKEPSRATPIALAQAAMYIENDPVFGGNDARDIALDYRRRASDKDARLWYAQLWLLLDAASKQGEKDQLASLAQLAIDFPEVSTIGKALGTLYARLGYRAEQKRTIVDLASRFPDDVELLRSLVAIQDETGERKQADEVARKIESLEPESTIFVERAIARNDLAGAAQILGKQADQAEGQARKRLLRRVADLLVRSGKRKETLQELERALEEAPRESRANLDLADARLAAGDHAALRRALAHALRVGSESKELREAIEAVDGMTELEPFRRDAQEAIGEFISSGAAQAGLGKTKGGTAARVLDYAALWVRADGSARMLEHEILFMQSAEAIGEHAEQKLPRGKLLKIRVVRADGSTYEPEIVAGKPTATMAHLQVGDYIETETLYDLPGDGGAGRSFVTPRWFFREEKVDYHHSEYVVITPRSRKLDIETTGSVPEPEVKELGEFTMRRWLVTRSPALPNERFSAPAAEFLPSVRAGWGVSQPEVLSRLLDASTRLVPEDPRLVRIAKTIASAGAPLDKQEIELAKVSKLERARRIYRWVLDNIEPTRENDPRKSVVGKSGSRLEAFLYLTRLVGVETRHALVQDRVRAPAVGPFSEAEMFSEVAVAIPTDKGDDVWTVVDDKYAPFGYMPSSLRGQPAVILRQGLPRVVTGNSGPPDGIRHSGKVVLAADGSGRLTIDQSYTGRLAIVLRDQIQKIPDEERLKAAIESELLPGALPGARVLSFEVRGLADLDAPLVLHLEIEVSALARKQGGVLVVAPPFASTISLGAFATLEKRETPIVFPAGAALRIAVELAIELPKGASSEAPPPPISGTNGTRSFRVADRAEGATIHLERVVDIPASRVEPADYSAFVAFARAADEALHRDIVVKLP